MQYTCHYKSRVSLLKWGIYIAATACKNLANMKKQQEHMDSFKKVLYLILNECHLRAYIDRLMTQL